MIKLFEILDRAETATLQGKPFEFQDSGVFFKFRSLHFDELSEIIEKMKAFAEGDSVKMARAVKDLLAFNPLVGWTGMTIKIFAEIAMLDPTTLGYTEEQLSEEVIPGTNEQNSELVTKYFVKNLDWAIFASNSVMAVVNEQREVANAQKKI